MYTGDLRRNRPSIDDRNAWPKMGYRQPDLHCVGSRICACAARFLFDLASASNDQDTIPAATGAIMSASNDPVTARTVASQKGGVDAMTRCCYKLHVTSARVV